MNDLSKRIAALSPEQQELLKRRLNQKQVQQPQPWVIRKRDESLQSNLVVSFGQQRMWFQDQLGTKSAVSNNVSISLRITGNLQVTALEQSLREIIQRHEVLRTNFQTVAEDLRQIIAPIGNWTLPIIDLRSHPISLREKETNRIAQDQACQPFNLETDLLLRTTLLQCNCYEYILLLTLHHIAMDAWSIGILFRELSALYAAFSVGKPSPLAVLPIQYADFAVWQREYLQGKVLENDLAYWKQKLDNAPDLLQLQSDRPRPSVQSFTGKTISFTIPKRLTDSLNSLSKANEATLFMTIIAALQTLLFRYTGQEDILVGSPIANRHQPEIENLIGCFINTLVLRTNLSGNPSFKTLLGRVRESVLGALAHQTLPFEKLVDELQLARNLTYAPLFQVMLVLQNAFSIENIQLPGLKVEHDRIDNQTAQFDLTFHLVEADIGLIGKLEYNTDLFDESRMTRMLGHFETLLAGIVENPDELIATLPLVTLAEQEQLRKWNQTTVNTSQPACIHHLFEAQVQKTPDAIAVMAGNEQLTYRELNQLANQLARYLQNLGVKPESLVGICVERSIMMLVGLLGVSKAGGAYVPIDPTYPQERIKFILSDAQVSVLLTQKLVAAKLPKIDAPKVFLDADWELIAKEKEENLESSGEFVNLAYIIYTSGSTGKPKGVMIEHQSLVNYTISAISDYGICASDRVLQFASISFDAAAEEIFPCLGQGATLMLRTEEMLSAMAIFLKTCDAWQITVLDLPTAFWHQMVTEMVDENLTLPESVRLVILGGEKAAVASFNLWQQRVKPHVRLVNSYGPTEATIVTTTVDLSKLSPEELTGRELPIGKPVRNVSTYILDPFLQPTPIGIPGELYIGGLGVARGYLNRPDLTAQVFIEDPSGARLYKTGDRARYWTDGTIEFLGRCDRQVKVRGFRIELGEIEALLTQHAQVQETVVIDYDESGGSKRLIAYIVPVSGYTPTSRKLRRFLEKRLPRYMMPADFILLEALPLNTNGKVDRHKLPVPEPVRPELAADFVAPRTATETEIARIFAEVLDIKQVGVDDDFFELGGHSLLATKLVARLLAVFEVELTIIDLFQSPTIAGLAERIEQLLLQTTVLDRENQALSLQKIHQQRAREMPVPLSFSQQSIWEWHHSGSTGEALNSSITIRIKSVLVPAIVEQSFNEIVRRHEILRTVFREVDGQHFDRLSAPPLQIVLPKLHLPLVYADLQSLAPEMRESEALNLAIKIAQPPFDLTSAPLMRTALFQLAPQEYWVLITMHHIITDGWSLGLLLKELETLIEAFSKGLPSPLEEVSLQYADFALWQRQVFNEAKVAQELEYWQGKLVDVEQLVEPPSFPDSLPSRSASHYFTHISESLIDPIESLSRSLGVTSFAILLAALKLALAVWSGQRDIWIFVTVGNRSVLQTENLIGCFINDVILRSQLLPEQTGATLIKQLQANIKEAIEHRDIPIEWVVEQIKPSLPPNLIANVINTSRDEPISDWEIVDMQSLRQQWEGVASELSADDNSLEIYLNISKSISIMVNYSVEQFTEEKMDRLFTIYEEILTQLVSRPSTTLSEFFCSSF